MPNAKTKTASAVGIVTGCLGLVLTGCDPVLLCGADRSPCPAGTFCKLATGTCDGSAELGLCTPVPALCTLIGAPVCGCDGETHGNPCLADAVGVNVAHTGACVDVDCCDPADQPGVGDNPTCIEGASCCADGQWGCNEGGGESTCDTLCGQGDEVCGGIAGIQCTGPNDFCKVGVGECCCDIQGVCTAVPDACIEIFDPVCGCDGQTYANDCIASTAGVNVDHTGECEQ